MDVASETMDLFRRHCAREDRAADKDKQQQHRQQSEAAAPEPSGPVATSSNSSSSGSGGGVDVHVTVLTQAHWPTQTLLELNLPSVGYSACRATSDQLSFVA